MRLLKSRGYNLYGIEPSPSLSAIGRDYFGLNIITGYLEEGGFRENFFTGVTLIDVLEHIPEPLEFLKEIHRILEPRGILFIRLPNGGFNLLKLLILKQILKLEGFDIFNETEHVNHYTTRTLQNLLTKSGFEIIEILPAHPVQAGARHGARGTSNPEYLSPWYRGLPIKTARILSFYLGLVFYFMLCRKILPFVPNLFIIARCKKEWC
jgi:SAM-dependent methyltransferase